MKLPSLLAPLLGLTLFGLAGCQLPPEPPPPPPPRVYLMLVVPEGMQPQDLPARREQVIRYLLESELLASREDLITDPELADRTIRATLLDDGFKLEFLYPASGRVVTYEPVGMPDDYYYYEGLIFYGTAGSIHRRHARDDGDRRPPPHTQPRARRGDEGHDRPPAEAPRRAPRNPGRDRDEDQPRTSPRQPDSSSPRVQPPSVQPTAPKGPGPTGNRPRPKEDRPTRDNRPAPREHAPKEKERPKDEDRPKPEPKADSAIVPAR